MKNANIEVTFENRILSVKLLDNVVITGDDLEEIYSFADEQSGKKPYGVIFEAVNHYKVTESGISFIFNNPHNVNVLAKAYVLNTQEAEIKTKAHLVFDNPALRPYTFKTTGIALKWLNAVIENTGS